MTPLDAIDRSIVKATQAGLPLTPAPYAEVAAVIGLTEAEVIERIAAMQERGIIRRIAIAPHHYALGMTANGMSVWDVDDDQISALGARIGALPYVTHCYQRPRARPLWPRPGPASTASACRRRAFRWRRGRTSCRAGSVSGSPSPWPLPCGPRS